MSESLPGAWRWRRFGALDEERRGARLVVFGRRALLLFGVLCGIDFVGVAGHKL